jgi:hypothetical protein
MVSYILSSHGIIRFLKTLETLATLMNAKRLISKLVSQDIEVVTHATLYGHMFSFFSLL